MSIPFVQEIKKEYPQAEIYIICKDWVAGIFENHQ
jgi:ADP-heptose:LPS heptosyltransferase